MFFKRLKVAHIFDADILLNRLKILKMHTNTQDTFKIVYLKCRILAKKLHR